jgi:hypothetical protein
MPKWLLPWLMPAALVTGVVIGALIGTLGGSASLVGMLIFVGAVVAGLVNLRLRYLKQHPSDPELVQRPFWRF